MSDDELGVVGPVGAFIRAAISEGLGVTAAREAMRAEGAGAMSNTAFGQLYGQIRDLIGTRSGLAELDYASLPGAGAYSEWAAGTPGRYATTVEISVRSPGTNEIQSRWYHHVTNGQHTPQAAIDAAISALVGQQASGLTSSGDVIVATTITELSRTVAKSA